jgi:hypothetical protein
MCAAALAFAAIPAASAQQIGAGEVMFHWGPLHLQAGQAFAMNVELTDHVGDPLTVPVELHVEDKNGAVIVSKPVSMSDGRPLSFVMANDIRAARAAVTGDIYSLIGPEIRLIQPCIRITFPQNMPPPVERVTVTLEVIDVATGRIVSVVNNPHVIIGVL